MRVLQEVLSAAHLVATLLLGQVPLAGLGQTLSTKGAVMAEHNELIQAVPSMPADAIEYTPTSLRFKRDLSYEEWEEFGAGLQMVDSAMMWWLGDWANYGELKYGERYTQAVAVSEATGKPLGSVRSAQWVSQRIPDDIRIANLPWNHHQLVAKLEPDEQAEVLALAVENKWTQRELRREVKRRRPAPAPPKDTYRIIYADPPWAYDDERATGDSTWGGAVVAYPTMTVDEICELAPRDRPIADWAWPKRNGAVLFLWATVPLFPEALKVVSAWGFTYKTHIVWHKPQSFFGNYTAVQHELLLLAVRGSCTPDVSERPSSVVVADLPEREHSRKPEAFRRLIDILYPEGPAIELFARGFDVAKWEPRRWDSWGHEA